MAISDSSVSRALTTRIGTQDPFGSDMYRIVTDWGNFARKVLTDGSEMSSKGPTKVPGQPKRLRRIEFSTTSIDSFYDDLDSKSPGQIKAGQLARELIRRALVIRQPISRGKEGADTQTVRWELRTVLMPGFNLALLRKDEYINIKDIDSFAKFLLDSKEFFDEKLSGYMGKRGQQDDLFGELPI
jgi:hypothetical protein